MDGPYQTQKKLLSASRLWALVFIRIIRIKLFSPIFRDGRTSQDSNFNNEEICKLNLMSVKFCSHQPNYIIIEIMKFIKILWLIYFSQLPNIFPSLFFFITLYKYSGRHMVKVDNFCQYLYNAWSFKYITGFIHWSNSCFRCAFFFCYTVD